MIPLRDDNPHPTAPIVSVAIIIACVLIFLWEVSLTERALQAAIYGLGATPGTLFGHAQLAPEIYRLPPWMTAFTSMFLHGGWMHLIGNMLYLWIFGDNIEHALGHFRFVVFYTLCGLAAVVAQGVIQPDSMIPMVGASGAISGVLGGYLMLYPRARILVLVFLGFYTQFVYLPALLMLGLWFGTQLLNSVLTVNTEGGGVAFAAHVGGFIAGLILVPFFKRRDVRLFAPPRRR